MNVNYLNKELNYDELSLSAFWWSLDGQFLLYASFNDSLVNRHTISLYADLDDGHSDSLPNVQHIAYPLVSMATSTSPFHFLLAYDVAPASQTAKEPLQKVSASKLFTDFQAN